MTNGNDSAYPLIGSGGRIYDGFTKREYFAAMAMQGMQAIFSNGQMAAIYQEQAERFNISLQENLAAIAVVQADALINELNKQP